ncbi:MAG: DNA polymerase III subunit gamma/tau C-terminal domain-containing protein, partial [Halochromatium sp.]
PSPTAAPASRALHSAADWEGLVTRMQLSGLTLELARHCAFAAWDGARLRLVLDPGHLHLRTTGAEQRLAAALAAALACDGLRLEIAADAPAVETPAQRRARDDARQLAEAERALATDPVARQLRERFEGEWIPGTLSAPRAGAEGG